MGNIGVSFTRPTPAMVEKGLVTVVGPPGPPGEQGDQGPQGDPGVEVRPEGDPPTNQNVIWVVDS